jgi:hypothetical protein
MNNNNKIISSCYLLYGSLYEKLILIIIFTTRRGGVVVHTKKSRVREEGVRVGGGWGIVLCVEEEVNHAQILNKNTRLQSFYFLMRGRRRGCVMASPHHKTKEYTANQVFWPNTASVANSGDHSPPVAICRRKGLSNRGEWGGG